MLKWEKNIQTLRETVGKYPQESYAASVRAVQSEWILFQCMTKYMRYVFEGAEWLLQETFLSRLFFVKLKSIPSIVGTLSTKPANLSGLGLNNPLMAANENS